ncbi:hypothetical protein RFI_20889, partial [Reticulomyxa filosa]
MLLKVYLTLFFIYFLVYLTSKLNVFAKPFFFNTSFISNFFFHEDKTSVSKILLSFIEHAQLLHFSKFSKRGLRTAKKIKCNVLKLTSFFYLHYHIFFYKKNEHFFHTKKIMASDVHHFATLSIVIKSVICHIILTMVYDKKYDILLYETKNIILNCISIGDLKCNGCVQDDSSNNSKNTIKAIYGDNKKEKESINESVLNTIKIINICIKYNASKHLLKHNISKYELQKEQQQKQELNKLIFRLQKNINNGNDINFYEIIKQLDIQFEEKELITIGKKLWYFKRIDLSINKRNSKTNDKHNKYNVNIHKEQNDFMKGKGIYDNIIILRTILYNRKYTEKKGCYMYLLDINKAFDAVWYDVLLYKLIKIGVKGKLLRLLYLMLTQGHLLVICEDCMYSNFKIDTGTGQVYHISGPIFNIYINDIIMMTNKENTLQKMYKTDLPLCLLYADDIITINGTHNDNNTVECK